MDPFEQYDPMKSNRPGFLARLSSWFRPWKKRADSADAMMLDAGPAADAGSELSWPRRRTGQIGRLEEAFDRLVRLVDTIDQHIQHQADRSEQSVVQTRRIADALAQTQALERQRTDALDELGNQFRSQGRQMQQVAEAVEALPRTIKQQSDQLTRIRDQLEAQLEAQLSTAKGIQQLAGAADGLRAVASDQRGHFERLFDATQAANLQIAGAMERQNRRFTWLAGLALVVGLAAVVTVAALAYAVFHHRV